MLLTNKILRSAAIKVALAVALVIFVLSSHAQQRRNHMGDQWISAFVNDHVQGWRYVGIDFTGCAPTFWYQYPNGIRDMVFQGTISANKQGTACLFPSDDRITMTWKNQVISTYSTFWSGPLPLTRSNNDTVRKTPFRYGIPKPGNDSTVYIFYQDLDSMRLLYDEIVVRPNSNVSRVVTSQQVLLNMPNSISPYTWVGNGGFGVRKFYKGHEYSKVPLAEWNFIASTLQCDPEHYWIVIYDIFNSRFQTLQLTPTGFVSTPINTNFIQKAVVRNMRFSTDGKKLAVHSDHYQENSANNCRVESRIYVMDFDITTGVPSNPKLVYSKMDTNVYTNVTVNDAYYKSVGGLEFSADNQYLFGSLKRDFVHPSNDTLFRWDAQANTSAAFAASQLAVKTYSNGHYFRDLKLGPDHKIYVSRVDPTPSTFHWGQPRDYSYAHLDAIYNANVNNKAMHYQEDEYQRLHTFDPRHPGPDVVHSFPRFDKSLTMNSFYGTDGFCANDTTFFTYYRTECVDSIRWFFGDTSNNQPVSATGNSTYHIYPKKFPYAIEVHLYRGSQTDTIWDTLKIDGVPDVNLGADTVLCIGEVMILGDSNSFCINSVEYTWSDSTSHPTTQIQKGGSYWLEVENQCGVYRDTIFVDSLDVPDVDLPIDTAFCRTDSVLLDATTPYSQYLWTGGKTDSTLWVAQTGLYSVTATNQCGTDSGKTQVHVDDTLNLKLGPDTSMCVVQGQQVILHTTGPANQFTWDNQSTAAQRLVNQAGRYWVSGSNTCNSDSDTIEVFADLPPQVNLGPDTIACQWNNLALHSIWPRSTYLWNTTSTADTLFVNQTQNYWLRVTNSCGSARDTVMVTSIDLPNPDIPTDTVLCEGDTLVFDAFSQHSTYKWNTNSQQSALMVDTAGLFTVTITNACGSVTRSIKVDELPRPLFYIPTDTVLCDGASWTIDLSPFQGTYLWEDNSQDSVRVISHSGIYGISVTNRCAIDSAVFEVVSQLTPEVDLPDSILLCEGESVELEGDLRQAYVTHSWSTGTNSPTREVSTTGTYWVKAFNGCGEDSDTVEVEVIPYPEPGPVIDTLICDGFPAQPEIYDVNDRSVSIEWFDGDSDPLRVWEEAGVFRYTMTNDAGCSYTDSIRIRECDQPLYIPNAFSPNQDGLNEQFEILGGNIVSFHLVIFDRWGHVLFESHEQSFSWDGRHPETGEVLPVGIYPWLLEYTQQDLKQIRTKGNVAIIR